MIKYSYKHKATYSETDQMGFVHHSNYARYYENARWAMFNAFKFPYSEFERNGFQMPVVEMNAKFKSPIRFEDEVEIVCTIHKIPSSILEFQYEIIDSRGDHIHSAEVKVAFIKKETQKACRPPMELIEKLKQQIEK